MFTVRGPHFEYHCLMIILESRCHHSSSLRMRKLRPSAVKEHAQPHSIAESTETQRSPQDPLPPCMCPQSGFSAPSPCPHGQVMRRVGTIRGHFLQASQQHPKMCPHCTDREGKGVQTKAQGSGWLTQDHTATQDWGPAASLHTLSPALPRPTL